jgi:transcription elongation factor GreA
MIGGKGMAKNVLTYGGLKKLEEELEDLKVNRRKEVAEKIKEAREQGDLSENAEYDAAKDEQRDIEARIEEIEKILKNAEVVDEDEADTSKVSIGCVVRILDMEYDEENEYKVVGPTEANILKGLISNESPVGAALIGKKVGDVFEVETQVGAEKYKVLEIKQAN